ncbi:hypothetical protein CC86DRAFT_407801 [Ophiobolus disseminans]|uniref:Uncharacterized protein n=1 Tax=Ophiobolus disseminans TaxID=1469910 RepID=A0A6A6ZWD5_9PLEO|nr:hypothetical protein CC86DRAFT_407801 [Ophiobolus disseminans]
MAKTPFSTMATTTDADKRSPAQSTEPTVVHLTPPMTVQPGTEILVTCNSPISVVPPSGEGHLLEASHPTKITALKHVLRISPTEHLGSTFASGWNKLPEELKMQVL